MYDLILQHGEIMDGRGNPPLHKDVAVKGELIAEIGDLTHAEAARHIDASGLIITPGFIDVHGHGDISTLVNPACESKIRQGITTQIIGNCGSSPYPLKGKHLEESREYLKTKYDLELNWETAEGYFARLEKCKPATNLASLVGQGDIRGSVMGDKDTPPTAEQTREMQAEVERAMDAGAIGLSTGLIYTPGFFATMEEIIDLTRVVAGRNGFYASHIRGEGDTLLEAIAEALEIGKKAGCRVQVSHLKASAPRNWGKVDKAIQLIEQAESSGLDVFFDKYPYTAGSTSLDTYLPRWAVGEGVDRLMEKLSHPPTRAKIFKEADVMNEGEKKWASVVITSAESKQYQEYEGMSITEIAEAKDQSIEEVFADLLVKSRARAHIVCFTQSQEDTDQALIHRLGLVCTDSGVWAPYGPLSTIKPHPRAYGTFPRFLKQYVKEKKALTREQAINKITGKAAERFGFYRRGAIKQGYFADLVLLDWEALKDTATYTDPHQYPEGVVGVLVNGSLTMWRGETTGNPAGKVLHFNGAFIQ